MLHDDILKKSLDELPARLSEVCMIHGERRQASNKTLLVDANMGVGDLLFLYAGGAREFVEGKNGLELVVGFHPSPATFIIDEAPPDTNPRATRLSGLGRAHFIYLSSKVTQSLQRDEAVAKFLRNLEQARMRRVLRTQRRLAFESAQVRCADMLIDLSQKFGVATPEGVRIIVALPLTDLARYLCLTPRHLRRFVPEWEDEKIIRRSSEYIEILEMEKLKALAVPQNSMPSGVV